MTVIFTNMWANGELCDVEQVLPVRTFQRGNIPAEKESLVAIKCSVNLFSHL